MTLEAAADVVDQIELRGSAQVAGVGQGANGLESMRSRDMNLGMADDGQTLQQATLVGEAVVRVAGGANAPAQQLASQAIDVEIAPDGQTVQGLSAQDDVQLDLPAASPGAPTRRIRSRSLDADGEPGVPGLRAARFVDDVEFREAAPAAKDKPAVERVVRAPALETKLQSGLGTIDRATFTEGVSVKDGTRTASGPTMIYDVAPGHDRARRRRPAPPASCRSATSGSTSRPARSSGRSTARAWSRRPTSRACSSPAPAPAGSKAVKRPSMLTADQPINVTAANMTYNQQTGHAEYTGDAQLWQGATSIRAKTITLDEATRQPHRQGHRALGDARRDEDHREARGDGDRQGRLRRHGRRDRAAPRRDAAAAAPREPPAPPRRPRQPRAARAGAAKSKPPCWRAIPSPPPTSWSTTTPSGAPATPAPPAWSASGATCAASGSSCTSTSRAAGCQRLEGFDSVRFSAQGAAGRRARAGATAAASPTSPTTSATC